MKLKQKLEGEDIEFIYICIDSNEDKWKLSISQMELDGIHYYCDKKQGGSIRSAFGVTGIPHYMLVNKQGHIVESGNYLGPSNAETIDKIKKLLQEDLVVDVAKR